MAELFAVRCMIKAHTMSLKAAGMANEVQGQFEVAEAPSRPASFQKVVQ